MKIKLLAIINEVRINNGDEPLLEVTAESNLKDDIGFSSFDLAELTVRVEDEFDIDIFEDGIVFTIGEIIDKLVK